MRSLRVLAVVIALLAAGCSSGGGESATGTPDASEAPATSRPATLGGVTLDGQETATMTISGDALPQIDQSINVGTEDNDPAYGLAAPELSGTSFDGSASSISNDGRPKAVYFVAHWCPHCQAEIPLIVDLINAGQAPEGLDIYVVSTGVKPGSPNFPPSGWLKSENWPSGILRDDEASSAAIAFGIGGFPYAVYLDADNRVVGRTQGRAEEQTTLTLWNLAASSAG